MQKRLLRNYNHKKYSLERNTMTIAIIVLAVVIIAVVLYFLLRKPDRMTQEELVELCEEMTKDCPKIVAENVRLDRVSAGQDKSMTYFYTMLKVAPNALNEENLNNMKAQLLKHYKTAKDFAIFRKNHVKVIFIYKDNDGKELLSVECK
ncbi:MAG: hypothetical protein B1H05_00990 [Candidatus Cloacimonas sp. 4484_140]|nr:MAG: hypothetical protein B1H05_00990 [Candidatus Cloacimonas sp. 4484_140]